MSETSETMSAEDRRAALEAELAAIQETERAAEAERRAAEQAELEAKMDPEQREQKAEIERRAKEQLDREFPPAWMPQKNSQHPDEIIGLVLRIDPRVGPSATFGTYSAVVEVRTTAGAEWTVWCNESGALYSQLTRLRIQPGEVIAVRYKGMKDSSANPGQSYHDFRLVRVDDEDGGPAAPVDYEALERSRAATPAELEAAGITSKVPGSEAPPTDDIPFNKTSYSNWL